MKILTKYNNKAFPALTLFDDFMNSIFNENIDSQSRVMPIDVIELDDKYIIKADLPGIQKKDVKISIKNNEMMLETCLETETVEENETVHRKERYSGCYQRILHLPEDCDSENVKAKLEDGVLELEIPKVKPTPKRQIVIE